MHSNYGPTNHIMLKSRSSEKNFTRSVIYTQRHPIVYLHNHFRSLYSTKVTLYNTSRTERTTYFHMSLYAEQIICLKIVVNTTERRYKVSISSFCAVNHLELFQDFYNNSAEQQLQAALITFILLPLADITCRSV